MAFAFKAILLLEFGVLGCFLDTIDQTAIVYIIAIGELFARYPGVFQSNFNGVDSQFLGNHIHLRFHCKAKLRCAMAALGGSNGIIGIYRIPLVFQVGEPVRDHGKAPGQKNDNHAAAAVCPAVIDDTKLLGHKGSIFFNTGLQLDNKRLAVTIGGKDLLA